MTTTSVAVEAIQRLIDRVSWARDSNLLADRQWYDLICGLKAEVERNEDYDSLSKEDQP